LTEPDFEPGTLLVDRYRIEGILGVGGMGRVYRARDEALGRPVALKVMHAAMVAQAARFEREARAGAALTHPAVVRVLAFGRLPDERPFLVFEFVEGENLSAYVRRVGPLGAERALDLLRPIAGALAEAHARGVIHRDLKPENLLIFRAPGLPESLRLLDFGIAGLEAGSEGEPGAEGKLTVTGQVFGTPEYMAPEQAMGRRTSPATDVWAFGATLHALLTGRSPFAGAHVPETLYRVVNAPPPPLPEGTPAAVADLVLRCLGKEPDARPADGAELLAALGAVTVGPAGVTTSTAPVTAPVGGAGSRGRGWPPRAVPLLTGTLGMLGGLGLGFALGVAGADGAAPEGGATGGAVSAPPAAADATRRAGILAALGSGAVADAVPLLRAHLESTPAEAREPALVAATLAAFESRDGTPLAEFVGGPMLPVARDRLLELAASPDPRLRWRAVRTFPPESPDARAARLQALRQDLRLEDCDRRKRTLADLAEMGDPSVIPDIRAMRQRFNFLENLCLGEADEAAIRRLRK
jgi:serine/threonine-protein kinase